MLTIIVTLIVLNIVLYAGRVFADSGAAGGPAPSADAGRSVIQSRVPAPERCPDAKRAVRYYQRRYAEWRAKTGAGRAAATTDLPACPRYLASTWKRKAYQARKAYLRWRSYHYDWRSWMPAKHQRVAACETGHQGGTGPGGSRWDWDSRHFDASGRFLGGYVSAFGIYGPGYDDDARRVGNLGWDETKRRLGRFPSPREQMQAVDSHRAVHGGWSGWGCRGA